MADLRSMPKHVNKISSNLSGKGIRIRTATAQALDDWITGEISKRKLTMKTCLFEQTTKPIDTIVMNRRSSQGHDLNGFRRYSHPFADRIR